MSRRANPTVIGAFVLGAAGLAVSAALLFGSGRLLESRAEFVLYFDEPVTGLGVGAPVIFQGVELGTVTSITAVVDFERQSVAVPVRIEIVEGRVEVRGRPVLPADAVQSQIDRGLRARLKSRSLITGQLYVDLDYYPDKAADYKGLDPETPEIPTIPTEMAELRQTLDQVAAVVRALPLEELVAELASAAEGLDRLANNPELEEALREIAPTLASARRTLEGLDRQAERIGDASVAALDEARDALAGVDAAAGSARSLLEADSPVQHRLLAALRELERAARSIRLLSDELAESPEAVIFGRTGEGS